MLTEEQIREKLYKQQMTKHNIEVSLSHFYDAWVNTTDDMKKAVRGRHAYEKAMHEIVWCNAVIGALVMVLQDSTIPTPGVAR